MKTQQTIFDTVVTGLRKQGVCATKRGTTSCQYRTPEGNKCGVGMLIPDEDYTKKIEGSSVRRLPHNLLSKLGLVDEHTLSLAAQLQRAHDNAAARGYDRVNGAIDHYPLDDAWLEECQRIANDFGLDPKVTTDPLC